MLFLMDTDHTHLMLRYEHLNSNCRGYHNHIYELNYLLMLVLLHCTLIINWKVLLLFKHCWPIHDNAILWACLYSVSNVIIIHNIIVFVYENTCICIYCMFLSMCYMYVHLVCYFCTQVFRVYDLLPGEGPASFLSTIQTSLSSTSIASKRVIIFHYIHVRMIQFAIHNYLL